MSPGITCIPLASNVFAPAGTGTSAPTAVMYEFSMTMVPTKGAAPISIV